MSETTPIIDIHHHAIPPALREAILAQLKQAANSFRAPLGVRCCENVSRVLRQSDNDGIIERAITADAESR